MGNEKIRNKSSLSGDIYIGHVSSRISLIAELMLWMAIFFTYFHENIIDIFLLLITSLEETDEQNNILCVRV